MRPSQLGWKGTIPAATKMDVGTEKEMGEMVRVRGSPMSPPPRYVNNKAAHMMFPSPAMNVRSPMIRSPIQTRGPPVSPKADDYQASPVQDLDRGEYGKGMRTQKEWDVERGMSEEGDMQPLNPRRYCNSRW